MYKVHLGVKFVKSLLSCPPAFVRFCKPENGCSILRRFFPLFSAVNQCVHGRFLLLEPSLHEQKKGAPGRENRSKHQTCRLRLKYDKVFGVSLGLSDDIDPCLIAGLLSG